MTKATGHMAQALHAAIAVGCAVVGLWLALGSLHDRHEPTTWGTFTASACHLAGRQGDECSGKWVSDDGTVVLSEAYLYQRVAIGTPVRAGATLSGWDPSVGEHEVFTHRSSWQWIMLGIALVGGGLWRVTHLPGVRAPAPERSSGTMAGGPMVGGPSERHQ